MADTLTSEVVHALFEETRSLFRDLFEETSRRMQETDRKIKEVSQLVGNLGNRLGEFVEHMVAPAVLRMFQERGIEVTQIFPNAKARRDGETLEVDILAVNGSELVATECKTKLSTEHVDEHIKRLGAIRRMFPQWANHRIYGAVATIVLDEAVGRYAEEKGLFVIAQSGDTVEIRNAPDFKPAAF